MEQLLQFFILLPLLGFIISLFFRNRNENAIAGVVITTMGLQLFGLLFFITTWISNGSNVLDIKHFTFYKEGNVEIFIDLFFDKITAVFAFIGTLITFLVAIFSRFYLHRDSGFKRFFNTLLLFFFAYSIIIFSGNFETLFVGWEFLGITSFLLIIFYRDRYLPVKNGLKTISLYRLGDVCLILAMWMSHHLWHENITFLKLNDLNLVALHIQEHTYYASFILVMIVIAASIKSAQFPFSSWLPRAMEGPTTSSAIFYGSLSAHIGVFILMRTFPYWESILSIKILVISIGLITAIIATLVARVQSSVKTQIAYGSIAQIGIMFIEVAMGWHILALVHFAGNAFLRTYQLLVSPSVLGYMIHDQFFSYVPKQYGSINKFTNSIYLLSLKEWNLDAFQFKFMWYPFKFIGRKLNFLSSKAVLVSLILFYLIGLFCFLNEEMIPKQLDEILHLLFAFIAMLLILKSFAKRSDAITVWFMIIASQFYMLLSIAFLNDAYEYVEILLYVSGLLGASILGFYCLYKIKAIEKNIDLNDFYGYNHEHPKYGFWFLISCLAFVGLPFSPTFIGVDLMFNHIDKEEYLLITITTISFLFIEIAVLRMYARLFLGPSKKQNHPIAYRSS
ncbi:proton-conducting transporter membrane subunit [Flavobacterium sp.]|uniref:proton-conducting transporter transmembrane domain-containing protein n=1 Tax=Flavobacterium sp. TaxID=239 RepID=UPI00374CBE32